MDRSFINRQMKLMLINEQSAATSNIYYQLSSTDVRTRIVIQ